MLLVQLVDFHFKQQLYSESGDERGGGGAYGGHVRKREGKFQDWSEKKEVKRKKIGGMRKGEGSQAG